MGEFRPPHRSDFERNPAEKWESCCLCDTKRIQGLVHFDSGSVTPTSGETVTGATSGDTMVLSHYVLVSGTAAGGDGAGILIGTSPTGYDDGNLEIFTNDENLNGSTSGNNFATVNKIGAVQITGRMVPDSEIIEYQGKKYCTAHFKFKFGHDWIDEIKIDRKEGDRE